MSQPPVHAAEEQFEEFLRSMPAPYASMFTREEAARHFMFLCQRDQRPACLSEWSELRDGTRACLLVAEDRKGLLAQVTRAFAAFQFDITSAQIFCRTRADGSVEAVDFFWVRPAPGSAPGRVAIEHVESRLLSLLSRTDPVSQIGSQLESGFAGGGTNLTRVYFEPEALGVGQSVLVVETPDYSGLLFAITNALYRARVEIIASDVRTVGGVARDRFTVANADGRPLHSTAPQLVDVSSSAAGTSTRNTTRLDEVCELVRSAVRQGSRRMN